MKRKVIYNGETLIKVVVRDKRETERFIWLPFKKRLLWKNRQEGFYNCLGLSDSPCEGPFTKEQLEVPNRLYPYSGTETYIVESNKVFRLPDVTLYFAGDHSYTKEFKTYNGALAFGQKQADTCMNIQLICK